jgi:predicted component of type VI protein secretion system
MKPAGDPPILLDDTPISFGSDRQRATIWIEDETLEAIHCSIDPKADGTYTLTDHHSVLGTWLNYTAITSDATPLHHGDVIQVGDLSYRYEENPPRQSSVIEVKPYNS